MAKNHIKVKGAKNDSLRGIGKLGWTESGTMHSTIKKLTSTFTNEKKLPAKKNNKNEVVCPVCNRKFNINNPNRLPNHTTRRWYISKPEICKGSWSQLCSDKKEKIYKTEISSSLGLLKLNDKVLIDFSRAIIQPYDNRYKDVVETYLEKIEVVNNLKNDGTVYSWQELLYFNNIEKPIHNTPSLLKHTIKV